MSYVEKLEKQNCELREKVAYLETLNDYSVEVEEITMEQTERIRKLMIGLMDHITECSNGKVDIPESISYDEHLRQLRIIYDKVVRNLTDMETLKYDRQVYYKLREAE
jgi:hypothetical protein